MVVISGVMFSAASTYNAQCSCVLIAWLDYRAKSATFGEKGCRRLAYTIVAKWRRVQDLLVADWRLSTHEYGRATYPLYARLQLPYGLENFLPGSLSVAIALPEAEGVSKLFAVLYLPTRNRP
jgi:hypothetical protein